MIEQLKTIRDNLGKFAAGYIDAGNKIVEALTQLEAMVGAQKPVAWCVGHSGVLHFFSKREAAEAERVEAQRFSDDPIEPIRPLVFGDVAQIAQQYEAGDMASASAQGFRDGVASVTQQHVPEADRGNITPAELARRIERGEKWEVAQQPQARPEDVARTCPFCNEEWVEQPQAEPDDEIIKERDDAEDFIDMLLDEVLGTDRPEWTSAYGRDDALRDVQERMTALHKPMVDKAWERFEKAQQPQARPDFTDEWAGYLKDGETPFERFLRERKDLQSMLKLYQRVLEENERLKAQQPQAEPFGYVSQHTNGTWEFSPAPAGVYPDTAKSITAVYTKQPQAEAVREQLRDAQVAATMPLIGPLLDAWDGLPNDLKCEEELSNLRKQIRAINMAMEGVQPQQAEAVPLFAALKVEGPRFHYAKVYGRIYQVLAVGSNKEDLLTVARLAKDAYYKQFPGTHEYKEPPFEWVVEEVPTAQPKFQPTEAVPAWTTEQITAVARPIAMAIAENCRTAPQLVFPHLFLGLKDLLTSTAPQQAEAVPPDVVRDARRYRAINTPEIADFLAAVHNEALHQRERWGSDHDAGKTDADWFWLLGYLGGKAVHAQTDEKRLHHIITTAAACLNWHAARVGMWTAMRPGIDAAAQGAKT